MRAWSIERGESNKPAAICNVPAYTHQPSDGRQLCGSSLLPLFAAVLAEHSPAHNIHVLVKF